MADQTYAQLKQAWLTNAKGTQYDDNEWASTMAAVSVASKTYQPVTPDGLQQLQSQGVYSFDSYSNGAYKAFVNTATSPQPVTDSVLVNAPPPGGGGGVNPGIGKGISANATAGASGGTPASDCAWQINPLGAGGIFFDLLGKPSWCILEWSQIRALAATGILLAGSAVLIFGAAELLSSTAPVQAITKLATRAVAVAA